MARDRKLDETFGGAYRNPDQRENQRQRWGSNRVAVDTGTVAPPPLEQPGRSPFVRLVFPPRIEKLPMSRDFNVFDFSVALGAGVGTQAVGPSFTVPQSQLGWLQQFWFYLLSPLATTEVRAIILINSGPVSGFDDFRNPPGAANFEVLAENDMRIRIPNGGTVSVLFENIDGAAVTVGARLGGWYHPEAEERRVYGEGYI